MPVVVDLLRNQYSVTWWSCVPPLSQPEDDDHIYRLRPVTNAYSEPNYPFYCCSPIRDRAPKWLLTSNSLTKYIYIYFVFTHVLYTSTFHSRFVWLPQLSLRSFYSCFTRCCSTISKYTTERLVSKSFIDCRAAWVRMQGLPCSYGRRIEWSFYNSLY